MLGYWIAEALKWAYKFSLSWMEFPVLNEMLSEAASKICDLVLV